MNLSVFKIGGFFLAIALLAWFLYPRTLFLGYIYEGAEDLSRSEAYYLEYLERKPFNKFASLRLADLYERMGTPEKATPLLKRLYEYRKGDWKIATRYLNHLESLNAGEELYRARQAVAEDFLKVRRFPRERVTALLDEAYQYALWKQRPEEAYAILLTLTRIAKNPQDYRYALQDLDRGLHKTDQVLAELRERLKADPRDTQALTELVNVMIAVGQVQEGKNLLDRYLASNPPSLELLRTRIAINEQTGSPDEVRADLERILLLKGLSKRDRVAALSQLAYAHSRSGSKEEALRLYRQALAEDRQDRARWRDIFYLLNDLRQHDAAIELLKGYLAAFGREPEAMRNLAGLYLYEKKDLSQTPFFLEYLQTGPELEFALDVAHALADRKSHREALEWLKRLPPLFGPNVKVDLALIDAHIALRQYPQALAVAQARLSRDPDRPAALLSAARVHGLMGQRGRALALYDRLASLHAGDARLLQGIGKEVFFLGNPKRALKLLESSARLNPQDAETFFWIAEARYSLGDPAASRRAAARVTDLLDGDRRPTADQARMRLKARGRLAFNDALKEEYRAAIRKNPSSEDLKTDYLDLLLDNREWKEAQSVIQRFEGGMEDGERRLKPYRVRLAFGTRQWKRAAALLEGIVGEEPELWSYRRDLGEAYQRAGRWSDAIREYERVEDATGNDLGVAGPLRELRALYDHRITGLFRFADLGADDFMEWGLAYSGFPSERLQAKGEVIAGRYHSDPAGFTDDAQRGRFTLSSDRLRPLTLEGGIGFGISPSRKTPSLFSSLRYEPSERLELLVSYEHRRLRTDLSQAVARGNLEDEAELSWQATPLDRLILAGHYEFSRNYLSSGAKARVHSVEPSVSYILSRQPFITVGYQYAFSRVDDQGGFLSEVNLLRRVSAHYLTGHASHAWTPRLLTEAGFFVGEDTARNLRLFKGELFGARARAAWGVTPWLDADASYDYGRESLSGIGGRSHFFSFGLSGHWR